MTKVMSAQQAAELVRDGDTVIVGGVVSMVAPEAALCALGERFVREGSPRNLTIICPNRTGWITEDGKPHGFEHLAHEGMIGHVITSTFSQPASPKFTQLVMDRRIEASVMPMGILFRWLRECTARSPGLLTEVGLGTFFEPQPGAADRANEGPVVARSHRVVKRVNVDGRDCLFVPSMKIDVSLIRGSVADTDGNLSMEDEPVNGGALQIAMAAKTSGGKVIAVVRSLAERGSLHPRMVQVPGIFVDAVVVDPDAIQTAAGYEPAFTGRLRRPAFKLPAMPLDTTKVILRRAAMELGRGDVINLGFGMGTQFPAVSDEEGFTADLHFSVEHGAVDGVPTWGGAFGAHYNPSAIIDPTDLFDFYHGGGLDAAILGFAEVDALGNVNVGGTYTGALRGPGGFADIAYRTRKVLICGTLTSGGLKARFDAAQGVRIVAEGRHRKFKLRTDHVDLYGPGAPARGQRVLVITERCVFEIRADGLTLVEVAPGIDVDRDIRPHVDFELRCAPALRTLPAALYADGPSGITLAPAKDTA